MRALVVFHDFGSHLLARFLKPGFKHCFVAIEADGQWITLDGRAGLPVVEIVAPADYDLATFYRSRGYAVIETKQRGRVPLVPFLPRNCVGLVKGILAISAVLALTPWQLFTHLARAESPGFQMLPGESDAAPDKPGKELRGLVQHRKAGIESHKKGGRGQEWDGPGAHRSIGGSGKEADQRDGDLIKIKSGAPAGEQSGELGGGSSTKPGKKEDDRRAGRAASILSGSEGIRDKLGRSGRRGVGKSLG